MCVRGGSTRCDAGSQGNQLGAGVKVRHSIADEKDLCVLHLIEHRGVDIRF